MQYRAEARAGKVRTDYEDYPDKTTLRASLLAEQRNLCCYCMGRIPVKGHVKVEHWHCQERYPLECLDYQNLLAACPGNEGVPKSQQFCDTRKGNRDLSRNPANPADRIEDLIRYTSDGQIRSPDDQFDRELQEVLNLNHPILVQNRRKALQGFLDSLAAGPLTARECNKHIARCNGEARAGELEPYCGVVVFWLRTKLKRLGR
jgi:uncharacterized protein (TIGR02646 family)